MRTWRSPMSATSQGAFVDISMHNKEKFSRHALPVQEMQKECNDMA